MANIVLNKPEAGQQTVLRDVADARLIMDFTPADALMERSGDNLVFTFDDGSSLVLEDFYTAYSGESLPDFEIQGLEVTGADFFAALDSSLMPAAGPAAGTAAARNAAYHTWETDDLMGGIDRLGGLDLAFNTENPIEDALDGLPDAGLPGAGPLPVNTPPVVTGGSGALFVKESGVGGLDAADPNDPNAGTIQAGGSFTVYDPDAADSLSVAVTDAEGNVLPGTVDPATGAITVTNNWGSLTVTPVPGPGGSTVYRYEYTMNDNTANSLNQGDTAQFGFNIVVTDSAGASVNQSVDVTLEGTNDRPELTLTRPGMLATEDVKDADGNFVVRGEALGADDDSSADLTYSFGTGEDGQPITEIKDDYGTLSIDPGSGEYTYTLDNASDAVQAMGDTDSVLQKHTVWVTDEHGATREVPLNVTIHGANDAPVLESDAGKIDLVVRESGVGGEHALNPDDPNSEASATLTDGGSFTVRESDSSDTLGVTIKDADGNVMEAVTGADGSITVTDAYGTLTVTPTSISNPDGSFSTTYTYKYELNEDAVNNLGRYDANATDEANAGNVYQNKYVISVSDGKSQSLDQDVNIRIEGANDRPELSLTRPNITATEDVKDADGNFVVRGTALGADDDSSADLTYSFGTDENGDPITEIADVYGTLTINPTSGEYTYTLNSGSDVVQAMGDTDSVLQKHTVWVKDEHGATREVPLNVTIHGANDAPVLESDAGKIDLVVRESGVGGEHALNPDDPNSEASATLTDGGSFTVRESDSSDTLGVTIKDADGNVMEAVTGADGSITVTDAYGTLTVTPTSISNPDGSFSTTYTYKYELNEDAVNSLGRYDANATDEANAGNVYQNKYVISVSDGKSQSVEQDVNIRIEGANERPSLEATSGALTVTEDTLPGSASEDSDGNYSGIHAGSFTGADADTNAELSYSFGNDENGNPITEITDEYGTLTIDPEKGSCTYTLFNGSDLVQGMGADESVTQNHTVYVTDEHGAYSTKPVSVTINGKNDAPVISRPGDDLTLKESGVGSKDDYPNAGYAPGDNQTAVAGTKSAESSFTVKDAEGDELSVVIRDASGKEVQGTVGENGVITVTDAYGTLTVTPESNDDGSVTYTYKYEIDNNKLDFLEQHLEGDDDRPYDAAHPELGGNVLENRYTISVGDGTTSVDQNVDIRIEGTNDRPNLSYSPNHVKEEGVKPDSNEVTESIGGHDGFVGEGKHREEIKGKLNFGDSDKKSQLELRVNMQEGDEKEYAVERTENGKPAEGKITVKVESVEEGADAQGNLVQTFNTNYGTLILNTVTGEYSFSLNGEAAQHLGEREYFDLRFPIVIKDQFGSESSQDLRVRIEGSNDRPFLTDESVSKPDLVVTEQGVDQENAPHQDGGTVTGFDDDARDGQQYFLVDPSGNLVTSIEGEYGTMTINSKTGEYTYTLNNDSETVQGMTRDDTETLNFNVVVKDNHGSTSDPENITVTINGTDDAPIISKGVYVENVVEEGVLPGGNLPNSPTLEVSGQITATDVDVDGSGSQTGQLTYGFLNNGEFVTSITTEYGTISIDNNGTYTYTLHDNSTVDALPNGATHTDKFQAVARDPDGNTSTPQDVTINIKGSNDRPVIDNVYGEDVAEDSLVIGGDGLVAGKVTEDGDGNSQVFTGTVGAHDPDAAESEGLRYSFAVDGKLVQTVEGKYGYISIDEKTGEYTYTLYNDSDAVQTLGKGELAAEAGFTVQVTDKWGASSSDTIHIKVEGTDDAPMFTADSNLNPTVTENGENAAGENIGKPSVSGTVSADDTDAGESPSREFYFQDGNGERTQTLTGQFGTITIDKSTGVYTYELSDGAQDALDGMNWDDRAASDPFKVYVSTTNDKGESSESSTSINVGINGANDDPFIIKPGSDLEIEINKGNTLDSDGRATGTLLPGDVDDATLTFHILGKNGEDLLQSADGTYGSLVIAPDGTYTYYLNPYSADFKELEGQGKDSFTVTVFDQHGGQTTQEITINVNPADVPEMPEPPKPGGGPGGEKPDLGGLPANINSWGWNLTLKVKEDTEPDLNGLVTGTGDLNFVHDNSGNHPGPSELPGEWVYSFMKDDSPVQSIRTEYGLLTIDPNTGEVSFVLDNSHQAVQSLKEGGELKVELPDDVRLAINGEVVGKDNNGQGNNNGNNGNGVDKKGGINITITGTNDQPELIASDISVTEDEGSKSFDASASDVDTDTKNSPSFFLLNGDEQVTELETQYGTLTIDQKTGEYTFTLKEGFDQKADWSASITVKVGVDDGSGTDTAQDVKDVTITIHGSNDGPTELTVETLTVTEDGDTTLISGTASAADDQGADNLTYSLTDEKGEDASVLKAGEYGTLILNPKTGEYSYKLDNNSEVIQGLGAGEHKEDSFWITVKDDHGETLTKEITVTINGTNDAPQLSVGSNLIIQDEDGAAVSDSATASVRDVDFVDNLEGNLQFGFDGGKDNDGKQILLTEISNEYGTFRIDPKTGEYSFTLNPDSPDLMGLSQGDMHTLTATVVVEDSAGATDSRDIGVNIKGTNSSPVLTIDGEPTSGDGKAPVEEGGTPLTGTFTAVDYDGSATVTKTDGTYGTVKLVQGDNGQWTYTYTLNNAKVDYLAEGERLQDTFTIKVKDNEGKETSKTVTVDIVGTNDAPVATPRDYDVDLDTAADGVILGAVAALATDADKADTLGFSFEDMDEDGDVQGTFGTLHYDADKGEYSYSLNYSQDTMRDMAQQHAESGSLTESFDYAVSDRPGSAATGEEGHSDTGSVNVTIGNSTAQGGIIGDDSAAESQLLLGDTGKESLHGGQANDYMSGGAGDDALYGGAGDDVLFGGAGHDYLDGGTGSNELYGGAGNDILVYSPDNTAMDGGEGIDFLIGADRATLDTLLGTADSGLKGMEVFITNASPDLSLTNMDALADMGISASGSKINLDWNKWEQDTSVPDMTAGSDYLTFTQTSESEGDAMTIVVLKSVLENFNG